MSFTHLLTDTIYYAEPSGTLTNSGDHSGYGSITTAAARHEIGSFLVRDSEGAERTVTDKLYTETAITAQARIWLPGTNTAVVNESREITSRREIYNPSASIVMIELFLA